MYIYVFSLGWSPSKVEGDISTSKEVHDCQIAFQKNCTSLWSHQQFIHFLICLQCWLFLKKKTKRLLLRLNKFSVWQPLKDLCFLTSMSVRMCNRNFLYRQKKKKKSHSVYKKRRKSDLDKSIIIRIYDNCLLFIVP